MNQVDRVEIIRNSLSSVKCAASCEKELQDVIERVFLRKGVPFQREVRTTGGFIDFVVFDRIVVEIKIKGSGIQAARQVLRYLEDERFDTGVIVTTKAMQIPESLNIEVISLWRNFI